MHKLQNVGPPHFTETLYLFFKTQYNEKERNYAYLVTSANVKCDHIIVNSFRMTHSLCMHVLLFTNVEKGNSELYAWHIIPTAISLTLTSFITVLYVQFCSSVRRIFHSYFFMFTHCHFFNPLFYFFF